MEIFPFLMLIPGKKWGNKPILFKKKQKSGAFWGRDITI